MSQAIPDARLSHPSAAGPAARAIGEELPENVAVAVIGFIKGFLLDNPHRVGRRDAYRS